MLSNNELLRPQRQKDKPSWKHNELKKPDCRPKQLLLSSLDGRPRKLNKLVSNLNRQWLSCSAKRQRERQQGREPGLKLSELQQKRLQGLSRLEFKLRERLQKSKLDYRLLDLKPSDSQP